VTTARVEKIAAAAGIIGPAAFVAAWAVGGVIAHDYSPVNDAISNLAAIGAPTRTLMTGGFLAFSAGVGLNAVALRDEFAGLAWIAALVTAASTVGVAAAPLGGQVDGLHGAFAGIGYASLVAVPALAGRALARSGKPRRAIASAAAAAIAAAFLVGSTLNADTNGLFQRLGLATVDTWLVVQGIARLRRPNG